MIRFQVIRPPGAPGVAMKLYLILYPKELEDEIIETLEAAGVPGYTEFPKLIGRGRRIRHFDNPIWPGATGAVFTVLTAEQEPMLVPSFQTLAKQLEERSQGLFGLHATPFHLFSLVLHGANALLV